MSDQSVPMAKAAPPQSQPAQPVSSTAAAMRSPVVMLIAGLLGGVLVACPCGLGSGWLLGSRSAGVAKDGGPVLVPVVPQGGDGDTWTHQTFQDFLAAKGMKTSRGAVAGIMWYGPGNGEPLNADITVRLAEPAFKKTFFDSGYFQVVDLGTSKSASTQAKSIIDIQQRQVISSRNFLIDASPEKLAELKKWLP